ncbi:MAG: hypothetical protein Q7U71_07780 [bacterium]|nr:hypothetical protein [bacterium]
MKKLLILVLLAPLFIGAAPPDPNQNTVEFWGGTGQYRRDAGCGHYQKVEYQDIAVSFKHKGVETEEYLNDSGKVAVRKVASPVTFILDASMTRGTAVDIDPVYYYDDITPVPVEETVEYVQAGVKMQADWKYIGFGLGGVAVGDEGGFGVVPAGLLRVGPRDQIYLTWELLYANPIRSGHGFLATGLGHQSGNLDLWVGLSGWLEEDHSRPCLTVKYHFGNMLLGVDASYGTSVQDGVRPYSVSVGVGYEY